MILHTVMTATDHVVCLNGHVCCSGSPMMLQKIMNIKHYLENKLSDPFSL